MSLFLFFYLFFFFRLLGAVRVTVFSPDDLVLVKGSPGDRRRFLDDTLVALDYDLKTLHPGLAQSWTISPDGLTYTFKLRPGIKFCSGKTLTAADVVASYNRWLDPETKGVVLARMGQVDAITAPDESTVVYKLKQPFSELLFQMTQHFHVVINAEQAKQLGQDFGVKALDGTGPYCFESWTPRDQTVLVRNPHYQWGPAIYADPKWTNRMIEACKEAAE